MFFRTSLSDREITLLKLLAEGYSSKQLVDQLGIKKNTIDTHRRNMLRKTGCKNTIELIVQCVRDELI